MNGVLDGYSDRTALYAYNDCHIRTPVACRTTSRAELDDGVRARPRLDCLHLEIPALYGIIIPGHPRGCQTTRAFQLPTNQGATGGCCS